MSWTYAGDLTQSLDWIRYTIGDTDPEIPLMSDEEISSSLTLFNNNKVSTAKECMNHILLQLSLSAVDYSIGPESVKASQRYKQYKDRYDLLMRTTFAANYNISVEDSKGIFEIGMMDNHSEVI